MVLARVKGRVTAVASELVLVIVRGTDVEEERRDSGVVVVSEEIR